MRNLHIASSCDFFVGAERQLQTHRQTNARDLVGLTIERMAARDQRLHTVLMRCLKTHGRLTMQSSDGRLEFDFFI